MLEETPAHAEYSFGAFFFHTGDKLLQSFLCQASADKCELKNN